MSLTKITVFIRPPELPSRAETPRPIASYVWISLLLATTTVSGLLAVMESTMTAADTQTAVQLRIAAQKISPLHRKKAPSSPDDWLATHDEPGQTFEQYRHSNPNRPTKARTTLYVQPIGKFTPTQRRLIDETAELLSRFYHLPTKVLEPLGLDVIPPKARRIHPTWDNPQILTTYVLDKVLKPRRPKDAVAVLALTTSDLWPGEGWNFVFGQASLLERVGVWSLYRYGNPEGTKAESQQYRRRMFKVAVHETGHMLGIAHCTAYECGMNGSNHLAEMDSRPFYFCPECVPKIWWACRVDRIKRYELLVEFASQHGLDAEAEFWQKSADCLRE
jgi:archaemetzincin